MKILVVVDMQNDFISGTLGSAEAVAMVPAAKAFAESFPGKVIFTRDTHFENYSETREGRRLPVAHCIKGTPGWEICDELLPLSKNGEIFDKPTFGSTALSDYICGLNGSEPVESVTLIGLCTDICVISNAMLIKAALPETDVMVKASCCAGVTPQSHMNALEAMKMCQIDIEE